jgi:hypothetical protein
MARNQYFVVLLDGKWSVAHEDNHYGPYVTQNAAIRAAVDAAHNSKGDSQVLIVGADNKFRAEWTYGSDPYPPPG